MELEYRVIISDGGKAHERQHKQQEPRITVGDVLELSGAERIVVRRVEQEPSLDPPRHRPR